MEDSNTSLERYQLALEGSSVCIWDWMDVNREEQWWSPEFYHILGYDQEELDASITTFKQLIHPDDKDKVMRAMDRHFEGGDSISLEYRLQTKSGGYKWFLGSARATFDEDGNPVRMAGSIVDIDDRKEADLELEKKRKLLRTIIDNIPACVYVKDREGRKVLANRSEYELWGYDSEEEILGKTDSDLADEANAEVSEREDRQVLDAGEPIIDKDSYTEINGEEYVLLVSKLPLRNKSGEIIGLVGISKDITDRKNMEDQLRERNQQLKKLNDTTNKIYSVIGHDLKTPLTSILGLSEMMAGELEESGSSEQAENMRIIRKAALNMSDLLSDLLSWARIQTGDLVLNKTEFGIASTIRETIELFDIAAGQKDITIDFDIEEEFQVYADEQLIATIVRNFISNAIKFSQNGDTIEIALNRDESCWYVSVRDEGVGMSEDTLDKLFDTQDHPNREGTGAEKGSGIGLRLCKELAELHDGQISVSSDLGEGSVFSLSIPRTGQE